MRTEPYFLSVLALDQIIVYILLFLRFLPTVSGLFVVTGSDCTTACYSNSTGSGYSTNSTDISCYDNGYSTTAVGKGFQTCVECEFQIPTFEHTTTQTDIGWALFNIRYTLGSCLFNFNNSSNTTNAITKAIPQCVDSCSKISDSIETNLANPTNATTYDYCSQPDFMLNVDACASCYNVVQNQRYLSNFLNVLQYACQYRPNTSDAFPIPPSAIFTLDPPTNYSGYSSNNDAPAGGLNAEVKTAIAISVPVCFFLIFTLILVCCYTHKKTKDLPPSSPSRSHSRRSGEHISKSFDPEKGWLYVDKSPQNRALSEKRSITRGTHRHSGGRSHRSRANNGQSASSHPNIYPILQQPLRTRSAHSQLGALYQQAKTSPKAPNPTIDTIATTYTTPSESLHSIPILVPSRWEPPAPILGPSTRWDDEPEAPTLLPPLRSSPSSRSRPPSRPGRGSRSGVSSRARLSPHSRPPSRSRPTSRSGPSSQSGASTQPSPHEPGSPSKRPPTLPPPSRWETPQTRNLPPLSRYTSAQPSPVSLTPHTHHEEPPRESSFPAPETFQPTPPRSLHFQAPNTQPMEEVGPTEAQLQTLQSLPPPPPSSSTSLPITSVYNPLGLSNWEDAALRQARTQEVSEPSEGTTESTPLSPVSPLTALPAIGGGEGAVGGGSDHKASRPIGSRRHLISSPPLRQKAEPSSSFITPPTVSTGRPLSRIPSAEEPPSRPSTAEQSSIAPPPPAPPPPTSTTEQQQQREQQQQQHRRPGSPHPGPRRVRGFGRYRLPGMGSAAGTTAAATTTTSTATATATNAPPPPSSLTASFNALPLPLPLPGRAGEFGAPMPVISPSSSPPPPSLPGSFPPPLPPLPSLPPPPPPPRSPPQQQQQLPTGFAADQESKETDQERARESLRRSISSEKARRERERREKERDRRGEKEVRWSRSVGSESGGSSSKKRSPAL